MNPNSNRKENVLVTGASSGIGQHLAREFARHAHTVTLVAPIRADLETVAEQIRSEFGGETVIIDADLTPEGAADDMADRLEDVGLKVEILCNNAGVGVAANFGKFHWRKLSRCCALTWRRRLA